MRTIKIFTFGAQSVGKTSILHQMVFGSAVDYDYHRMPKFLPTIEDVYFATIHNSPTPNQPSKNYQTREDRLLFFDAAGIKQNIDIESLRNYLTLADEFILVYAINDRSSFDLIDTIKTLIDQSKGKRENSIIVLGNKLDLDSERQVGFEEAHVWAKKEHIKLFEVTATERETLNDFMLYLSSRCAPNTSQSSSAFKLRRSKTNQSTFET